MELCMALRYGNNGANDGSAPAAGHGRGFRLTSVAAARDVFDSNPK